MDKRTDVKRIDLKKYIDKLTKINNVSEIYLFGSRAYKTGCLSSDIDILLCSDSNTISSDELNRIWIEENSFDFFITYDKKRATSVFNNSSIYVDNLVDKLDAKLLWSKEGGYQEMMFEFSKIEILRDHVFEKSYLSTHSPEQEKFYNEYGYNAIFVIMPFTDECNPLYNIVKDVFESENKNFKVTRASDKELKEALWDNVQVYLDCCKTAVSIFHYDKMKKYNPNVAIETGYMMANLGKKDICILKDKRLEKLPTDFLGKLYKEYDINNLDDLKQQLKNWIKDHLK